MSDNNQETEAKFYVQNLDRIKKRLGELGAHISQQRVLEMNLRFDLPDESLRRGGRVLRLRRDTEAKFTYKGASKNIQGVLDRQEIEFVVGDFDKAKQFLEALGYQQIFYYEKYRITYEVDHVSVMVDELPYGNFVEIEDEAEDQIRGLSQKLGLDWDSAIQRSYTELFEDLRKNMRLPFQDLSFVNFQNIKVNAAQLRVHAADS